MNDKQSNKKFRDERVLQIINKCISLKETSLSNEILQTVLNEVLTTMKKHDDFFREHFQAPVYVGSYYKGTKVGKAEEFDVNLIIQLPLNYELITFQTDIPGFTKLKLQGNCYKPAWETHKKVLSKFLDENQYLNQDKFRQAMERRFTIAMRNLPENDKYTLRLTKSGPAFTIFIKHQDSEINVDLVPVLAFKRRPPLPGAFSNGEWYAVPKPFKNAFGVAKHVHLHWRMSFYKQEQEMFRKHGSLKPTVRQIKKLRDTEDWKIIPSYHIETLFMHHISVMETNSELLKMQGLELLVHMLNRLKGACETRTIANFWDQRHNLMEANDTQMANIVGRLGKIIKKVNENPLVIATYLLTKDELVEHEKELNAIQASCIPQSQSSEASIYSGEEDNGISWRSVLSTAASIGLMAAMPSRSDWDEATTSSRNDRNIGHNEIMDAMREMREEIAAMRRSINQLSVNVERLLRNGNVRGQPISDNSTPRNMFDSAHLLLNTIQSFSET